MRKSAFRRVANFLYGEQSVLVKLTRKPYTTCMSNVTQMTGYDPLRRARAQFVKTAIDNDDRSVRYIAGRIGINHTSLADRVKGKVAFSVEDLEGIAYVLKRDPMQFIREYLAVGPEGLEPPASSVKSRELAEVLPFPSRAS